MDGDFGSLEAWGVEVEGEAVLAFAFELFHELGDLALLRFSHSEGEGECSELLHGF